LLIFLFPSQNVISEKTKDKKIIFFFVLFPLLEFVEHLFEVHQDYPLNKHIDLIDYVMMLNDQQHHIHPELNDFHHPKENYDYKYKIISLILTKIACR
jgi:hypothetical protein